jgi:tetratricopeptide (TPR) repeat protein
VSLTALAVALTLSGRASAAEQTEVAQASARSSSHADYQQLVDEGMSLYKAHEHRLALEKFLQAYAIEQDPNLLFNIARCYEARGDHAAAIEKYEQYLADPNSDPQGKERARKFLHALRKDDKPQDSSVSQHRSESPNTIAQSSTSKGADGKVIVGWIATAVFAAGATVTGILAIDAASQLRTAKDAYPGNAADIDHRSNKTLALSITADALGVAAVAMGGLSLYWTVAGSASQPELKAAVGPGGLRFVGAF